MIVVSQFTLLASTKKGNKPDFHKSASGDKARELYAAFFTKVQEMYEKEKVKDGVFQAMMEVTLVNDGPVSVEHASTYCMDGYERILLADQLLQVTLEINTNPPTTDEPGEITANT